MGYRLWGRTESDTTEATWQQALFTSCDEDSYAKICTGILRCLISEYEEPLSAGDHYNIHY